MKFKVGDLIMAPFIEPNDGRTVYKVREISDRSYVADVVHRFNMTSSYTVGKWTTIPIKSEDAYVLFEPYRQQNPELFL